MPILDWIGKKQVINHDKEVPFRLLKRVHSLSVGESENLIIKGDNLEALKALLPYYYNKVKCIYIDPPYNTGNENWIYNDKVNSPEMKKWLGRVVGSEGEDLSRHDKWLCMMYPRLKLLRELLSDDGVIFVSIDDNEVHHLRILMDEVFGEGNLIATFIWKKKSTSTNVTGAQVSSLTDYVLCYGRTGKSKIKQRIRLKETRDYPYEDKEGRYRLTIIEKKHAGSYERKSMLFPIIGVKPREGKRWQIGEDTANELEKKKRFIIDNGIVKLKIYDFEDKDTFSAQPNLLDQHGTTDSTAKMVNEMIFGQPELFDNPKPIELISHLITISSENDDIILDSFAGSGTTAHAVLELNKEDSGNRKFILVEMEDEIARKVTAERVKRVIKGYTYKSSKGEDIRVEGLGGGFQFMNLDTELFDAHGLINDDITYIDLARYIFFSETKLDLKEKAMKDYFIGERNGTEYYLIYKQGKENILNEKTASKLKKPVLKGFNSGAEKEKIVYADNCTLDSDTLDELNIIFKQIPYEVRGF